MKKNTMNTQTLLELIDTDNRPAFNMFYDLYYDQVFRYAYYFLKDTEACREVVSDVFFAVWQSRKKMKQVENLESYLFVVVRNEVTRYHKRADRKQYVSLDEMPVQVEIAGEEAPDDRIASEEMEALLGRIIGTLPEKCRVIFLMARQEGLKTKEIADRLALSENTVRVQMKIAVDKIVSQIKPHYPDLAFSLFLSILF